jgi:hypothetical protein
MEASIINVGIPMTVDEIKTCCCDQDELYHVQSQYTYGINSYRPFNVYFLDTDIRSYYQRFDRHGEPIGKPCELTISEIDVSGEW